MPVFATILLTLFFTISYALADPIPVRDIQFTEDPDGVSPLNEQSVEVTGLISGVTFGSTGLQYFLSDPNGGPWSGVLVFDTQPRTLAVGDSVTLRATVAESGSQTRLNAPELLSGPFAGPRPIPAYAAQTGAIQEQHEGVLVELSDAVVTEVSGTTFMVSDGSGALRVREGFSFGYEPFVGETLQVLRGIISFQSGEFAINPRNDADFIFESNRPPIVLSVEHTPELPNGATPVTVTASFFDDNNEIAEALVFYRFGASGDFAAATMHDDGTHGDGAAQDGVWGALLPAGPQSTTAYYYVSLRDGGGLQALSPEDAPEETYSYYIRSIALTIRDIQFINEFGGDSTYNGQSVTVTGIVTGANYDGGTSFFMSDPGGGPWSGVYVYASPTAVTPGDCVQVSARVQEFSGITEFSSVSRVTILGQGTIPPPDTIETAILPGDAEQYEGGFVYLDTCVVTSVSDFGQYAQWEVSDGSGPGVLIANFGLEYIPEVGDTITFVRGCVDYHTSPGHMVAPRNDADMGVVDHRAPRLTSAITVAEYQINLLFNERLSASVTQDLNNFEIVEVTNPEFPRLHVQSAALFRDGKTIQIETLESLPSTSAYQIYVRNFADVHDNVTPEATVGFGGYFENEVDQIADIYNNFARYNSDTVRVTLRGIVNFVQDVTTSTGTRRISAFIQDNSGRGFNLSQNGAAATFPGIVRGNLIEITGRASEYQTAIQLGEFAAGANSADVRVLAENMPLPEPIVLHTGDLRSQAAIVAVPGTDYYGSGTWCRTTGTIYQVDENVGGGTNIFIDDGSGNTTLRVWDSMELDSVYDDGAWLPLGELVGHRVSIAGPSSTYNGDFQMLAGYAEDFTDPDYAGEPSGKLILDVPNRPFAPDIGQRLKIFYDAPPLGAVRLRLFNLRGQLVHTFVDKRAGGPQRIDWDGRDQLKELLPLGSYILHLESIENGKTNSVTKPIVVGTRLK